MLFDDIFYDFADNRNFLPVPAIRYREKGGSVEISARSEVYEILDSGDARFLPEYGASLGSNSLYVFYVVIKYQLFFLCDIPD